MNNMNTINRFYIFFNLHIIINEIKTGIKYMYVENMFVNNEEISAQELCKLNDEEFRYQVKTAIDYIILKYEHDDCKHIKRYISRMSTKQMKKIFNYSEINDFYLDEVSKQLHELK